MAVRIPIRIEPLVGPKAGKTHLDTSALANAGYETNEVECAVPAEAARKLGLWPRAPRTARQETYTGFAGRRIRLIRIPQALSVQVVVPGREPTPVKAAAVISGSETEVVLNDTACDELEIVLVKPHAGLWTFRGEPGEPGRPSIPPQEW